MSNDLPKLPLALFFGLAVASLVLVTGARFAGFSPAQEAALSQVTESRLLQFQRGIAGGIDVIDAATGETIATAGSEGFVPGVLRGLDRLRRTNKSATSEAYRLERLDNGQLLLTDTVSGVTLDLAAYGRANARVFAAFLPSRGDQS